MDKYDVLTKVRDLIADRESWSRIDYAQNEHGISVSPSSKKAIRWCVLGAFDRVNTELSRQGEKKDQQSGWCPPVQEALDELPDNISTINCRPDGHERIVELLDAAIGKRD